METGGKLPIKETEANRSYKIEHLPEFDAVENLDYLGKKDRDDILEILRKNRFVKDLRCEDLLLKIENLKDGKTNRFFIKSKHEVQEGVDFILGRTTEDTINSTAALDFNNKARYALVGIMNEIILSKEIKELVASKAVQDLAKKFGFAGIGFSEPIFGIIDRKNRKKFLIYKNVESKHSWVTYEKLAKDLRIIFFNNGIYPHDLRGNQFMLTEENGKPYLVLIDIEAYKKIDKPDANQSMMEILLK